MHSDKVSSTASESRKSSKPIMEKRRRARINASLAELKSLLLEVMKKEGARQNKMEKADILEMTVKHLRQLQRQQLASLASSDPAVINKYRLGFNECASEVSKFLGSQETMDAEIRARLLNHLANVVVSPEGTPQRTVTPQINTNVSTPSATASSNIVPFQTPVNQPNSVVQTVPSVPTVICSSANTFVQPQVDQKCNGVMNNNTGINLQVQTQYNPSEINNNTLTINTPMQGIVGPQQMQLNKVVNGLQVLPTKMSSGEMALIIPANLISGGIPNYVIPILSSSNLAPCQTSLSPVNISQPIFSSASKETIPAPAVTSYPINIAANSTSVIGANNVQSDMFERKNFEAVSIPQSINLQPRTGPVNLDQNDSLQKLDNMWRPW